MNVGAVLFDAYGTLFDVYSVTAKGEALFPGKGSALAQLWRSKQLEYTWLRSLMNRYEDFESVTRAALGVAAQALGLPITPAATDALMAEYLRLAPFPDVKGALARLSHLPLGILSNGTPKLLKAIVDHAGLGAHLTHVLSVDALRVYKPDPRVYQLGVEATGVAKAHIAFVSSNYWDIAGATAFGFQTYWINRAGAVPDALDFAPRQILASLDELVPALG